MNNARKKLELHMDSAMPCEMRKMSWKSSLKEPTDPRKKNCDEHRQGEFLIAKTARRDTTVNACTSAAHESTRKRNYDYETRNGDHEGHIADKVYNSMSHDNLAHNPIPIPRAMKIPDAKDAVDKECDKFKNLTTSQSEQDVIEQVLKENKKQLVHSATLVDLDHLKNSESDKPFPKHKRPCRTSWRRCETQARLLCSPSRDLPRHTHQPPQFWSFKPDCQDAQ